MVGIPGIMKMNKLLKQVLLVCVCLFTLTGQAIADSLSDANRAYDAGKYAKAAKLLKPLAEHGDAGAQTNLGLMYDQGKGVPRDYKEAVKWFRLAAKNGYAPAQSRLGDMYFNGRGVLRDYKEAVQWFRLAAENGYVPAQSRLGDMYQNELGVPKNYVLAQMWKNIAAANAPTGELKQLKQLTLQQIVEAQELARKCTANKFKGC
jgi:uncharacterized protein